MGGATRVHSSECLFSGFWVKKKSDCIHGPCHANAKAAEDQELK